MLKKEAYRFPMRKGLSVIIIFALSILNTPLLANDEKSCNYDFDGNEGYESPPSFPLEKRPSSPSDSKTNISMIGWGLGLSIAIAILAGTIHQSKGKSQNPQPSNSPNP